jgi:uncharacterized protein (TIGR03435 family)
MKKFGIASLFLILGSLAFAQDSAKPRSFEVASVKVSPPLDQSKILSGQVKIGQTIDNARVEYHFVPLIGLLMNSYKLQLSQITGPPWLMTERYDIVARMPAGATKDDIPELMKSIFTERFGMKFHMDNKEQAVYVLTQAKGGSKLKEANADTLDEEARQKPAEKGETVVDAGDAQVRVKQDGQGGSTTTVKGTQLGTIKQRVQDGNLYLDIQSMTIEQLGQQLSVMLGKPVIDKTGLTGRYSMSLEFSLAEIQAMAQKFGVNAAPGGGDAKNTEASDPGGGTSMFKSVEKLGLKLESARQPVAQMIIDHIDKTPTEN